MNYQNGIFVLKYCGYFKVRSVRAELVHIIWISYLYGMDRLCGLVVRVSGYRYRGPGFDPRRYQIF